MTRACRPSLPGAAWRPRCAPPRCSFRPRRRRHLLRAGPRPPSTQVTGTAPAAVVAADFNRDGKVDVVTTNSGSSNISLLLGNGSGGLAPTSTTGPARTRSTSSPATWTGTGSSTSWWPGPPAWTSISSRGRALHSRARLLSAWP